jgi:predicted short-subunit dehydrogenase-like oxidoreductase (DUF2520 family)
VSDPIIGVERLRGAQFCVEGDHAAVAAGHEIAEALGGTAFSIDTRFKTLYHAAAVTACGHVVALIDTAAEMLSACGFSKEESKSMLLPLLRSTVDNIEIQTLGEALTGPFARGDSLTFDKHMAALAPNVGEDAIDIYLELAGRSLKVVSENRALSPAAAALAEKISLAKTKPKC